MADDKDASDWVTKERIRALSFKPGDDVEEFCRAIQYWIIQNAEIGKNVKTKILVSRLNGEASNLGVKLASEGKSADEILVALKSRFGKSYWQTMENLTEKISMCKTENDNSVFTRDLYKCFMNIPEDFRAHADFVIFMFLFSRREL